MLHKLTLAIGDTDMWITEIRHPKTGELQHRSAHGKNYTHAMDMHNYFMRNYAECRVHLVWEE